jgi:hypothetical protein
LILDFTLRVKRAFFRSFLKLTSICVHLRFISLSRVKSQLRANPGGDGNDAARELARQRIMKIPAMLLIVLACWVGLWQAGGEVSEGIGEQTGLGVAIALALAFSASLAILFIRAGRIRLEDDRLVVQTPLGFCKIPYAQIETIRRCRRSGRPQHLQIIFGNLGKRKILQVRPRDVAEFAAQLRRKCPQLSSSSDVVLVRRGGEGKLIHYA